ncbi:MAG: ferritin family protein [candidate division Zixibacteria bacterium]|nr:ferritin family protein [candidate division Zixibacteria bacterium]
MSTELTLERCVEFAISTEENGAKFYNQLAEKFGNNKDVADLFTRLSQDEEVHKKQFSKLLKELPNAQAAPLRDMDFDYIVAMSSSEFFSYDEGPFKNIERVKTQDDALGAAFELEKATLSFYNAVKEYLGENNILNHIIEAEKGHVVAIMKVMVTGGKFRSLQDKW